jgi:hypothetical protein
VIGNELAFQGESLRSMFFVVSILIPGFWIVLLVMQECWRRDLGGSLYEPYR